MEQKSYFEFNQNYFFFIGKMLSTFSHELRNHLSIINEYMGLMDDYYEMNNRDMVNKKFKTYYININNKIEESLSLISVFNRFAHRLDSFILSFNPHEVIEEVLILMNRRILQHNIEINYQEKKEAPPVQNSPLIVQYILFSLLNIIMEGPKKKYPLNIEIRSEKKIPVIVLNHDNKKLIQKFSREIISQPVFYEILKKINIIVKVKENITIEISRASFQI